ncbi:hypothetical protein NLI96_g4498 [Meripilus lineatus]|uniref:Ricin B lectin domain-containing protein n=1 Tax=Meripilus lineatus TaxID=2056292 RepID=A0AAD5V4T6_9APHY|nr:hypothetical protein NLI96_g4498 [Physisporinus lineatus]
MAQITPGGTYKLINAKRGLALDLSDGDKHSITGYDYHGGSNQQWVLEPHGEGYYIRSVSGSDKYLTIKGVARVGLPVIGADHPALWDIRPVEEDASVHRLVLITVRFSVDPPLTLRRPARIFLWGTIFNIELFNFDNPPPGTVSTCRGVTNL